MCASPADVLRFLVTRGAIAPEVRQSVLLLWAGCIAGAVEEDEYRAASTTLSCARCSRAEPLHFSTFCALLHGKAVLVVTSTSG